MPQWDLNRLVCYAANQNLPGESYSKTTTVIQLLGGLRHKSHCNRKLFWGHSCSLLVEWYLRLELCEIGVLELFRFSRIFII